MQMCLSWCISYIKQVSSLKFQACSSEQKNLFKKQRATSYNKEIAVRDVVSLNGIYGIANHWNGPFKCLKQKGGSINPG